MTRKISVCIPCYNVEKYLENLFDCLEKQTFQDFDIVFLDDGSTDNTLEKIKKMKTNSFLKERIYVSSQKNKGISSSRNELIKLSKGEYIFFLDPDDEIPPTALEDLYSNTNNGEIDIVVGRAKVKFKEKYLLPFIVQYVYSKEMDSINFVKSNLTVCWGSLLKKKIFDNISFLDGYTYEDLGVMNYVYLKTKKFKSIKNVVYIYKRRKESISDFSRRNMWKIIDLYMQTNYAFSLYKKEGWLNDKKLLRSINGTLFQIKIAVMWLSEYYSDSKHINNLALYAIERLLNNYSINLKFSKTFWKSLSYIYISFRYKLVRRCIKKDKASILLRKIRINNSKKIRNKKNTICFIDDNFEKDVIIKNNKTLFFTTNKNIIARNVYYGIRPDKINDKILEDQKIYFIDIRNIGTLSKSDAEILKKVNPRIMIISNKENYKKIANWICSE